MANPEHLLLLKQGVNAWNQYRATHRDMKPELDGVDLRGEFLSKANLTKANFIGANLSGADLRGAFLSWAKVSHANLSGADLTEANLTEADLSFSVLRRSILTGANLSKANLSNARLGKAVLEQAILEEADLRDARMLKANFTGATLIEANLKNVDLRCAILRGAFLNMADLNDAKLQHAKLEKADLDGVDLRDANLSGANLSGAFLGKSILVRTNFTDADLTGCCVYGIAAWDVNLTNTKQEQLVIGDRMEAEITVDNLEVAQFIYLLLNNQKIRRVIDTVTSKAVLILGRFTDDRKRVLDKIREELRNRGYLPILFDFEKPPGKNLTETISTLAHMAKFIIADLTDAKSVPQELQRIIPQLPSVPIQPIILASQEPYAMFESFDEYGWVLKLYKYKNDKDLLNNLDRRVILPAIKKLEENKKKREKKLRNSGSLGTAG